MTATKTPTAPLEQEAELLRELAALAQRKAEVGRESNELRAERDELRLERDRVLHDEHPDTSEIDARLAHLAGQLGQSGRQSIDPRLPSQPPVLGDIGRRLQIVDGKIAQVRQELFTLHQTERAAFIELARETARLEVEAAAAAAEALRQYEQARQANARQWVHAWVGLDPSAVERGQYGVNDHEPDGAWLDRVIVDGLGDHSRGRQRATVAALVEVLVPGLERVTGLPQVERAPVNAYQDHVDALRADSPIPTIEEIS